MRRVAAVKEGIVVRRVRVHPRNEQKPLVLAKRRADFLRVLRLVQKLTDQPTPARTKLARPRDLRARVFVGNGNHQHIFLGRDQRPAFLALREQTGVRPEHSGVRISHAAQIEPGGFGGRRVLIFRTVALHAVAVKNRLNVLFVGVKVFASPCRLFWDEGRVTKRLGQCAGFGRNDRRAGLVAADTAAGFAISSAIWLRIRRISRWFSSRSWK